MSGNHLNIEFVRKPNEIAISSVEDKIPENILEIKLICGECFS